MTTGSQPRHMPRRHAIQIAAACTAALLLPTAPAAFAQDASAWPTRPVKLIVPYAAGGFADTRARKMADKISQRLGQPVVVDNRGGAGGVTGTDAIAKATDGHTFGFGSPGPLVTNPMLMKKLPYNAQRDLQPIILIEEAPLILSTAPNQSFKTVADLLAAAKAKPGTLTYGSSGVGGAHHLSGELLAFQTQTNLIHVPYKSTAEVSRALLAGEVVVAFDNLPVSIPQIRAKKVVLLGITGQARYAEFPDCPTFAQLGYETLNRPSWFGLSGPAGLSPSTAQTLMDALTKSLKNPDLVKRIGDIGGQVKIVEGKPFSSYVEQAYSIASATESPRVLRRLQPLRRWSHEEVNQVFPRSPRTCCSHGAGAPRRVPIVVGCH